MMKGSSNGKKEHGAANLLKTQHGFPVAQPQSEENVPNTTSDTPSPSDDSQSDPIPSQETENPPATLSHSDSPGCPGSVQPPPARQGPQTRSMTPNKCSRPFESRELMLIAQRICAVWSSVASLTGKFASWEIDNISLNQNYPTPDMKADKMLNDFKSRFGTREVLASALRNAQKPVLADKVLSGFYISNSD